MRNVLAVPAQCTASPESVMKLQLAQFTKLRREDAGRNELHLGMGSRRNLKSAIDISGSYDSSSQPSLGLTRELSQPLAAGPSTPHIHPPFLALF